MMPGQTRLKRKYRRRWNSLFESINNMCPDIRARLKANTVGFNFRLCRFEPLVVSTDSVMLQAEPISPEIGIEINLSAFSSKTNEKLCNHGDRRDIFTHYISSDEGPNDLVEPEMHLTESHGSTEPCVDDSQTNSSSSACIPNEKAAVQKNWDDKDGDFRNPETSMLGKNRSCVLFVGDEKKTGDTSTKARLRPMGGLNSTVSRSVPGPPSCSQSSKTIWALSSSTWSFNNTHHSSPHYVFEKMSPSTSETRKQKHAQFERVRDSNSEESKETGVVESKLAVSDDRISPPAFVHPLSQHDIFESNKCLERAVRKVSELRLYETSSEKDLRFTGDVDDVESCASLENNSIDGHVWALPRLSQEKKEVGSRCFGKRQTTTQGKSYPFRKKFKRKVPTDCLTQMDGKGNSIVPNQRKEKNERYIQENDNMDLYRQAVCMESGLQQDVRNGNQSESGEQWCHSDTTKSLTSSVLNESAQRRSQSQMRSYSKPLSVLNEVSHAPRVNEPMNSDDNIRQLLSRRQFHQRKVHHDRIKGQPTVEPKSTSLEPPTGSALPKMNLCTGAEKSQDTNSVTLRHVSVDVISYAGMGLPIEISGVYMPSSRNQACETEQRSSE